MSVLGLVAKVGKASLYNFVVVVPFRTAVLCAAFVTDVGVSLAAKVVVVLLVVDRVPAVVFLRAVLVPCDAYRVTFVPLSPVLFVGVVALVASAPVVVVYTKKEKENLVAVAPVVVVIYFRPYFVALRLPLYTSPFATDAGTVVVRAAPYPDATALAQQRDVERPSVTFPVAWETDAVALFNLGDYP